MQHHGLQHSPAQGALIFAAKVRREQLADGVGLFRSPDAVQFGENVEPIFVKQVRQTLGHKQEVAPHEPHRDRFTDCGENAQAGRIGNGFFLAPLLLLSLEPRITPARLVLLLRMVDGPVPVSRKYSLGMALAQKHPCWESLSG